MTASGTSANNEDKLGQRLKVERLADHREMAINCDYVQRCKLCAL